MSKAGSSRPCLSESAVAPDHGGLIHDEDRAFSGERGECGGCSAVWCGFAQVNAAVNGTRLKSGITAHDLGGAACGGEQFNRTAEVAKDTHECGHGGGFSRTGITTDHETAPGLCADQKPPQRMNQAILTGGWSVRKCPPQAVFNFVGCWGCRHVQGLRRLQVANVRGQSTDPEGGRPLGIH